MNILFLAEAATATTRHFYAGNTVLFRTVKTAFEQQFGCFADNETFLEFFGASGCKLDHLCPSPVSGLPALERVKERSKCIRSLAERLAADRPAMIIVVMKSIVQEVLQAVRLAAIDPLPLIRATPFPAMSEQNRAGCITGIRSALEEAVASSLLTGDG